MDPPLYGAAVISHNEVSASDHHVGLNLAKGVSRPYTNMGDENEKFTQIVRAANRLF